MKCPICSSDSIKVVFTLESPLGRVWDIYECLICKTQFIYPMPSQNELNQFYDEFYHGADIAGTKSLKNPSYNRAYWQRQWRIIQGLISLRSGRVLDFGCGSGNFLDNAGVDWEKYGVEISEEAGKVTEGKGIEIFKTLKQAGFPSEFFDLVTMFNTIEHLPNPKAVVDELAKTVKRDGLFVIMTGDTRSFKAKIKGKKWHMYRPPEHVGFFCAHSLDFIMRSLGFTKVRIRYTDGGMTHISFRPLNMALRAVLIVWDKMPVLQSLPVFDHNYSYYKKIS